MNETSNGLIIDISVKLIIRKSCSIKSVHICTEQIQLSMLSRISHFPHINYEQTLSVYIKPKVRFHCKLSIPPFSIHETSDTIA
jgi:hypothetical protein